ncbi:hypothetical protein BAE46_03100 [Glaciecola punicea]|uniref:hypothetical protein n=1 Tax=Glaciecola punicea TaxID=56804 RepID=UPI000872C0DC|nr:hypothetical protein [Glaciecola punicea]OFA32757.1 hypothetical protein BAE46_03100 [Glaciecola punicea]
MKRYILIFLRYIAKIIERTPSTVLMFLLAGKLIFQRCDAKFESKNDRTINVLGNGPSCHSTFNEHRKAGEDIMVVNFFATAKEFFDYKPSHYLLIDPLFFSDNSERFIKLYEVINSATWHMVLFVPANYYKIANNLINSPFVKIGAIRFNHYPGENKWLYRLYKSNLVTPKFQNVVIACLYLSVNEGYSTIKLHGVEADEFKRLSVNNNNEVLLETEHFYGKSSLNLTAEGRIEKGGLWKYLKFYSFMFEGFLEVEKYSKFMKCQIINFTENSTIDSFYRNAKPYPIKLKQK